MADRRMDAVGKVERCGALDEVLNVALGRIYEDIVREEVEFYGLHKLSGVLHLLLPFHEFLQPCELLAHVLRIAAFFIHPVRCNTVFSYAVHFVCADLHFKRHTHLGKQRCMQRLIHILFRNRNIVFKAHRKRCPFRMERTKYAVAVLYTVHDHADRDQIIELIKFDILGEHLLVNTVNSLETSVNFRLDAHLRDLITHHGNNLIDICPALIREGISLFLDLFVIITMQYAQRNILKFMLKDIHTETVCQRCINLDRLLCLFNLFIRRLEFDRTHIVQTVCKLNDNYADIRSHRKEHLAEILCLRFFLGFKIQFRELCHAINNVRDLVTEHFTNFCKRNFRILGNIMQHTRADRHGIKLHFRKNAHNIMRMDDIRLSRFAQLSLVCGFRDIKSLLDQLLISIYRIILYKLLVHLRHTALRLKNFQKDRIIYFPRQPAHGILDLFYHLSTKQSTSVRKKYSWKTTLF